MPTETKSASRSVIVLKRRWVTLANAGFERSASDRVNFREADFWTTCSVHIPKSGFVGIWVQRAYFPKIGTFE
ncbi:MAG: hypothetical protein GY953_32970 [bacterium]|nr:hypothetical protein [bacterium]